MTTLEGNKLIAEFMGENINLSKWGKNWEKLLKHEGASETPNYHTSWDWQVPVWSKAVQLSHKLAMTPELADYHNRMYDKYNAAVFMNKPELGHEVIVDFLQSTQFIQWYNNQNTRAKVMIRRGIIK